MIWFISKATLLSVASLKPRAVTRCLSTTESSLLAQLFSGWCPWTGSVLRFPFDSLNQACCPSVEWKWARGKCRSTEASHPRSSILINLSWIYNPVLEMCSKSFQMYWNFPHLIKNVFPTVKYRKLISFQSYVGSPTALTSQQREKNTDHWGKQALPGSPKVLPMWEELLPFPKQT